MVMKMFKNSFWGILKKGYWDSENTDEVFEPIINFLVNHKDQYIFDFHDLMSEFLYELDRKEIYEHSINQEQFNEEDFLNKLNDCLYSDYTINFNLKDIFEEPSYIKEVLS